MARCYPANNRRRTSKLRRHGLFAALLGVLLTTAAPTLRALSTDKDQQMFVDADTSRSEGDKEVSVKKVIYLHGTVKMVQGSIHAHGDDAVIYMDKDDPTLPKPANAPKKSDADSDKSKVQRVILTGKLAHMDQLQDNDGGLMTGDAEKLDYKVNLHLVELTGNVTVVQEKQGTFHGEHMLYNTLTGEMTSGDDSPSSRVHIILQPKEEKTDAAKPAEAKPAAAPAPTPEKPKKNKAPPASAKPVPQTTPPVNTTDGH